MAKIIDRFVNRAMIALSRYKDKQEVKSYIDGIRSSYDKLTNKEELTKEQEGEIQEYYTSLLGHPIPLDWHRYFYARTGVFSEKYMPTSLYRTELMGRLNDYTLKKAYTDKNISDLILPMAPQPKMILKNMNGYYYVEGKSVSKEEAIERCSSLGKVIIKPSTLSRGRGVQILNLKNGINEKDGESIAKLFDGYKKDFVIEEVVTQHERMAALNPSSVNTIRILTYRNKMGVKAIYTVIRIGRKDQTIDNESAGGISARINPDGRLAKYAFGAPGVDHVEYTDSGVKLENYEIPHFDDAVDLAKQLHLYLPFFNIVGWDMAITPDGSPIMIEFNVNPDLSQSANGPAFGNYTEEIIKEAIKKKNTWSKLTTECLYKGI